MSDRREHPLPGQPPATVGVYRTPPAGADDHAEDGAAAGGVAGLPHRGTPAGVPLGPHHDDGDGRRGSRDDDGDDEARESDHPWARRGLQALGAVVVLGLFLLLGWFLLNQKTAPAKVEGGGPVPSVEVVEASRRDVPATIVGYGPVRARNRLELSPRVEGRIVEVHPDLVAGGVLSGGTVAVRLDSTDFDLALQRARADVDRARADRRVVGSGREAADAEVAAAEQAVETAEAQSAVAIENYEETFPREPVPELAARLPQLREARARLEAALAGRRDVDARLAAVDARLAAAQAAVATAEANVDRTRITLPGGDGQQYRVAEQSVAVGRYVTPNDTLAQLYDRDALEAVVPLEASELAYLDVPEGEPRQFASTETFPVVDDGPLATLRTTAGGANGSQVVDWPGRLVRTEGAIDPQTRLTNAVVAALRTRSDGRALVPGEFVEVAIEGQLVEDVYPVPANALRPIERGPIGGGGRTGYRVFLADDGALRFQDVRLVRRDGRQALVRGLSDGDRVILTEIETPTDGMEIQVAGGQGGRAGGEPPTRPTADGANGLPADEVLEAIRDLRAEVQALRDEQRRTREGGGGE